MKKIIRKGFTLIELIIVIAIVSLLATVVLANLSTARSKARDTTRVSDLHQIQNALELYRNKYGYYPVKLSDLASTTATTFISAVPIDPQGNNGSACRIANSTSNGYCYAYYPSSDPTSYHIGAQLEGQDLWRGDSEYSSLVGGYIGGFNGTVNYILDTKF